MQVTLGGDRLGSGNKQKINLHGFERSTFNKSYLWRSTMSPGTLVPCIKQLALPGDTFDIQLNLSGHTLPTVGPLFGSYKAQIDVFIAPIYLYQGQLNNNKLGVGMNIKSIKLPFIELIAKQIPLDVTDLDNAQINPSCILKYLGHSGVGNPNAVGLDLTRARNAVPLLMYYDTYKNYYANKMEEIGAVIHKGQAAVITTVSQIEIFDGTGVSVGILPQYPAAAVSFALSNNFKIEVSYATSSPVLSDLLVQTPFGEISVLDLCQGNYVDNGVNQITANYDANYWGTVFANTWNYRTSSSVVMGAPEVVTFPLANIDTMRERILAHAVSSTAFDVKAQNLTPYSWVLAESNGFPNMMNTQEGLCVKTYQSDLFNNWLNTDWIDGTGGIRELTSIDVSGGTLAIDDLIFAKKLYNVMNRIAVSGGNYDDWINVNWDIDKYKRTFCPMYMGGLSKEIVFQEVISNSQSTDQPLGTLAGRGVMSSKHKGGYVHIRVDEPSYIMAIVSLTPRIDYSQGNDWDNDLETLDDIFVPGMNGIGFQPLITEQMAWWDTATQGAGWVQKSAGKQPAWINYQTEVNKVYGNFAIPNNQMFMVLNRRYEPQLSGSVWSIKDLTTYIDPVKYNHIFAQTSIDAQNFWIQVSVDMQVRRKMSATQIPNL